MYRSRGLRGPLLLVGAFLALASALPAQSPPPHAAYRTFDTPHFRIVYAEGLREVALRTADHVEEAHRILSEGFFPPPRERIEVLLTDHADLTNGFANSTPRPRMTLWVRPPMDARALSHFDDWLGLVSMHELAHVFHLEQASVPGRVLRRLFGRPPHAWPFFPGHLLPQWAIEGSAVHRESEHTPGGRLHGTEHRALVRGQALGDGVEGLPQALGRSPNWPGGSRAYVLGSLFFDWLDEEYGPGTSVDFLAEATTQWVPYRLDAAARAATGHSLGTLWDRWREDADREAGERAADAAAEDDLELLTRDARSAVHPAPAPSGGAVAYMRADGRSQTRVVLREADGTERALTRWNHESRLSWAPDGTLLATQPDYVDPWRIREDLYRIDPAGGVRRLTEGRRISWVDARPSDGRIAAVQEGRGTNRLVLLDPGGEEIRVLREARPGVHWAHPRWSPDGERLAVVRWREGGHTAIALLDPGREGEVVVVEDRALHTAPAWSPDGRWLLWASDRDGAFNLVARRIRDGTPEGPLRQITASPVGASHPAVDPEGLWIHHTRLGDSGWDLARIPFEPGTWREASPVRPRFAAVAEEGEGAGYGADEAGPPPARIVSADRSWGVASALASARPHYWFPTLTRSEHVGSTEVLPTAIGFETGGEDLVGRHRWSLESTLPLPGLDYRPDLHARWRWSGLGQPALAADLRVQEIPLAAFEPSEAPGDSLFPVARERAGGLDLEIVRRRVRSVALASAGLRDVRRETRLLEADGARSGRFRPARPDRRFTELRALAAFSTQRAYPFSVSVEEGVALTVQGRHRRERALPDSARGVAGLDGGFEELVAVGRAFLPVELPRPFPAFARGTLGIRGAAGVTWGPGAGAGHFRVGGGGGGGSGTAGFTRGGSVPLFPVRGHRSGAIAGDRAWAASAELRVPLANLNTGRGALPLHLDRIAGGGFVDLAGAGRPGGSWETRASAGMEVTLSHSFLFRSLARWRAGIAFPIGAAARGGPGLYLHTGWSF